MEPMYVALFLLTWLLMRCRFRAANMLAMSFGEITLSFLGGLAIVVSLDAVAASQIASQFFGGDIDLSGMP